MPLVAEWLRSFGISIVLLTVGCAIVFARMDISRLDGLSPPILGRSLLWRVLFGAVVVGAAMSATAITVLHSSS
jgi:hypothetical protein